MTRFQNLMLASAALAALGFATQAAAQPAAPQSNGAYGGAHRDDARWQDMRAKMQARRAEHDRDLATILRLRPDQQGAFQAFTASMHPAGDHGMRHEHDRAGWETMTTPQRLDAMAARMAEHQQRFQQHMAATKAFYAALSAEQQKVFDALGREHGGMGGGRHWGGRMGHGGWEHGGMGEHPMGPPPQGE